jgi:hypothetical protein
MVGDADDPQVASRLGRRLGDILSGPSRRANGEVVRAELNDFHRPGHKPPDDPFVGPT